MDSRGDKSTGKERGNAVVAAPIDRKKLGQIVLVLQGGALGAFCRNLADDLANKSDPDL